MPVCVKSLNRNNNVSGAASQPCFQNTEDSDCHRIVSWKLCVDRSHSKTLFLHFRGQKSSSWLYKPKFTITSVSYSSFSSYFSPFSSSTCRQGGLLYHNCVVMITSIFILCDYVIQWNSINIFPLSLKVSATSRMSDSSTWTNRDRRRWNRSKLMTCEK